MFEQFRGDVFQTGMLSPNWRAVLLLKLMFLGLDGVSMVWSLVLIEWQTPQTVAMLPVPNVSFAGSRVTFHRVLI